MGLEIGKTTLKLFSIILDPALNWKVHLIPQKILVYNLNMQEPLPRSLTMRLTSSNARSCSCHWPSRPLQQLMKMTKIRCCSSQMLILSYRMPRYFSVVNLLFNYICPFVRISLITVIDNILTKFTRYQSFSNMFAENLLSFIPNNKDDNIHKQRST